MTTTELNTTELKMRVMMTFNAPLHTHEKGKPGKEHLGSRFHSYIDNQPQEDRYTSYCGRIKDIRTMECPKQNHNTMVQCKDCLKKAAKRSPI